MKLKMWRLYSINDLMIYECGAVGGMKIDKGRQSSQRKLAPVSFVHGSWLSI
jgi:hypothetical protein